MTRRILKVALFSASVGLVSPLILVAWLEKHSYRGEVIFSFCAQLVALVPGRPGSYLRGAYYFGTLSRCSWETHIGFGSIFTHRGGSIGPRASMGSYCVIGHADIGEEVMMGSRVSVPSGRRQHLDDEGRLTSGTTYEMVGIGSRTWIGEGAIIMADVGPSAIVSAGAVVTKPMPARCIIGGNPARIVRALD